MKKKRILKRRCSLVQKGGSSRKYVNLNILSKQLVNNHNYNKYFARLKKNTYF